MRARYFAYGSNLKWERMRSRVPSARPLGLARLAGMRLTLDKRGADGTGKANLAVDAAGLVWGVVYGLEPGDWARLDACEPDYERVDVEVDLAGTWVAASTYVSQRRLSEPLAWAWYKRLIVEGAREHGLPDEWLALLEALPTREP